mgnify:CR=1 FL=1
MGYPIWNRRRFLKTAAGTAGFLAAMPCLNAAEVFTDTKPLKVGLVGCGGRGLGAMKNALDADPGTMVWALADVFQERIDFGAKLLAEQYGNRAQLDRSRLFSGLDSYKRLLQTDIDVVLLCTPPAFRPEHLAAAIDATGSANASVGYGIAYPFGVVGVVLFVQLVPKFLKTDMAAERARFEAAQNVGDEEFHKTKKEELFYADSMGFFPFALAIVLGIILAKIVIPLPGGAEFSLGTSGGPLIAGLILGHFGKIGRLSMKVEKHVLECLREFGLALFLIGAGVEAGAGFVEILQEEGLVLFIYGALITLIPMFVGYFFAAKVLKLSLFNSLGSICGGMTSTPALGTLIRVTETDDVASAYAATYPVALVFVVLGCQFIGIFL